MTYSQLIKSILRLFSKTVSSLGAPPGLTRAMSDESAMAHAVYQQQTPELQTFHAASTHHALRRIAARGMEIATVIDVGASNGMWSAVTLQHFPFAQYFLIEAQQCHEQDLITFCSERANCSYTLAAAGDTVGEIYFDDRDPFGGVASKIRTEWAATPVRVTTVDQEVGNRHLPGPYLIKLDTHGFEMPILEGAKATLAAANLLCIEAYNFRLLDDSLLFYELCSVLDARGFHPIDFSEPLWRDYDKCLWQFDLFFVPKTRQELAYNQYR